MNYQMWVGNQFYSRESYLKEAKKMGASKKVAYVPHGLVLGKSKIYVISDMTEKERETYYTELSKRHSMAYYRAKETGNKKSLKGYGSLPRGQPFIFGYFIVNAIVRTVDPKIVFVYEQQTPPVEIFKLVDGEFGTKDERGCGSLKKKALYLISETSMQRIKELYESPTLESENVIVFDEPIPYEGKHFRGVQETDLDV